MSEGACVHMAAVQERSLGCARDDDGAKRYQNSAALLIFMRRTTISHFSFLISNFSFKRSFQTQSKGSIPQGLILNPKRRCEITIISFSRSICRGGLAALIGVTGKPYPSCLSCHSHPIRPFRAPSPRGEGCDTRIPSSKKRRRSRHESPEP